MPFNKKCKGCGKVVIYEHPDELAEHFYKKSNYYMGKCKECDCKDHKEKFKSGKYNYYRSKIRQNANEFYGMGSD
jgi:hypothetical protein